MAASSTSFRPGQTGNPAGKPKGTPNRTTLALKEAIIEAAELTGLDGKGKDGLIGYLRRVAVEDMKAFSALLGRVLPLQVSDPGDGVLVVKLVRFSDLDNDD